MQILGFFSLAITFLSWPLVTGILAQKLGRKFWPWFFAGLPLPFIAVAVLLFVPMKNKRSGLYPVERENVNSHLSNKTNTKKIGHGGSYSATA